MDSRFQPDRRLSAPRAVGVHYLYAFGKPEAQRQHPPARRGGPNHSTRRPPRA